MASTSPVSENSGTIQQAAWKVLTDFLSEWFYRPDLEALAIALSTMYAHSYPNSRALGLFVVGNSGSGKTALICRSCLSLPQTYLMGDLSTKAFLTAKKGAKGILQHIGNGGRGILVFKDLTSLLSKRDHDRAEIIGQIREVMDGVWRRATGDGLPGWAGKVSVIAASTPALERAWAVHRELGERFVTVRVRSWDWRERKDRLGQGLKAQAQVGHDKDVKEGIQQLTRDFYNLAPTPFETDIPDEYRSRMVNLGDMLAVLRAHVTRVEREIVDVPAVEDGTRLAELLTLISRAYADLFQGGLYDDRCFQIAQRVAFNSIPQMRFIVLRHIPTGKEGILAYQIAQLADVPYNTVKWQAEELASLGVIEPYTDQCVCTFKPAFLSLVRSALGRDLN